jgi:uncharacterized membrane protein
VLIQPDQTFTLFAIIAVSAALGFWIDSTDRGKRVPGILVAILIPTVLASTSVIPSSAPLYESLGNYLIPLAIPLLLFQADFRKIYRVAGPLLLLFVVAAIATLLGVTAGVMLFDLGADESAIAAVLSASYIGGSSNLVAVSQMIEFKDPASLSIAFAADAVGGITFLLVVMTLPMTPLLRRYFNSSVMRETENQKDDVASNSKPLLPSRMLITLALSAVIVAAAGLLAEILSLPTYMLLLACTIALLVANLFPGFFSSARGAEETGMLLIYLYMPVIGAYTDLRTLSANSMSVIGFALTLVSVHLAFLLSVTKIFKLDVAEALIASNACILGGPTASAMAATFNWRVLVTPGLLCGVLGGAIANFIGVAVFQLLG